MLIARRTAAAEADLQEIAFQIAVRDKRPLTADRVIEELIQQSEQLAWNSNTSIQGTAASELGKDVRFLSYRRWVIILRNEPLGVVVLRFAHRSQDYLSWELS